ncbi:hypothetical protein STEG23_029429 [Scotinomys teguina]
MIKPGLELKIWSQDGDSGCGPIQLLRAPIGQVVLMVMARNVLPPGQLITPANCAITYYFLDFFQFFQQSEISSLDKVLRSADCMLSESQQWQQMQVLMSGKHHGLMLACTLWYSVLVLNLVCYVNHQGLGLKDAYLGLEETGTRSLLLERETCAKDQMSKNPINPSKRVALQIGQL